MSPLPRRIFIACLWLFCSTPAWAFPAPDLVINLFGNAAQLIGMLAASVGAAWFGVRGASQPQARAGQRAGWLCLLLALALFGSLCVNAWQYWQQREANARRLQTAILRPSPPTHPVNQALALARAGLEEALRLSPQTLNIIDVREPEEFELSHLPGARNSRYADLTGVNQSWLNPKQTTLLVCDTGFRSGEICTRLNQLGYPCRYMQGGYSAWAQEKRPLTGGAAGTWLALPHYAQENILFDTEELTQLVQEQDARLLDLRSLPGAPLPHAIRLSVRETPSADLAASLAALPKQPLVAVCDDNRSCFYSKVLGLRLSRLGYDFRGRYTLAHEFPIPRRLQGSFAGRYWEQFSARFSSMLSAPLEAYLQRLSPGGNLWPALLLLAGLMRLLSLPLALRARREQQILPLLRARADAMQELDTLTRSRLLRGWLRRAAIHPWRSLVWTLLQLFALSLIASLLHDILQAHSGTAHRFAPWAEIPAWHSLPLLIGLLGGLLCAMQLPVKTKWRRWLLATASGALIAWACAAQLRGVQAWFLCALLWMLVQQIAVDWRYRRIIQPAPPSSTDSAKARNLLYMRSAGLPVPPLLLLGCSVLPQDDADLQGLLSGAPRAASYAVRSASADEDDAASSQAGQYLSLLHVAQADLAQAVRQVAASMKARAPDGKPGAVIVQAMLQADYAGVLFTEHPHSSGCWLLEAGPGSGAVVGGEAAHYSLRIGAVSGQAFAEDKAPPFSIAPLLQLARQAQALFGPALDLEWAYAQGRFWLLQARPITRRCVHAEAQAGAAQAQLAMRESMRAQLLQLIANTQQDPCSRPIAADAAFWLEDEVCSELPQVSPVSLSLLERIHGPGGAVDLAWQELGFDYLAGSLPQWDTVFGQCRLRHCNARSQAKPGLLAQLRFAAKGDALIARWRQHALPAWRSRMRLAQALDLSRLSVPELQAQLRACSAEFVQEIYRHAEVMNLAARLYADISANMLRKRGLDPAPWMRAARPSPDAQALHLLAAVRDGRQTLADYCAEYGHRAPHDFELAMARDGEQSEILLLRAHALPAHLPTPAAAPALPPAVAKRALTTALARAQDLIALKEEAKHEAARMTAHLRHLLLELDARLHWQGGIFYLRLEEIEQGDLQDGRCAALIAQRRAQQAACAALQLPRALSLLDLERMDLRQDAPLAVSAKTSAGELRGLHVAGQLPSRGRIVRGVDVRQLAQALKQAAGAEGKAEADAPLILLIANADPAWTGFFPRMAGVICAGGGMLCHAAIMAREFDVPAIFAAAASWTQLQDGMEVELAPDGEIRLLST